MWSAASWSVLMSKSRRQRLCIAADELRTSWNKRNTNMWNRNQIRVLQYYFAIVIHQIVWRYFMEMWIERVWWLCASLGRLGNVGSCSDSFVCLVRGKHEKRDTRLEVTDGIGGDVEGKRPPDVQHSTETNFPIWNFLSCSYPSHWSCSGLFVDQRCYFRGWKDPPLIRHNTLPISKPFLTPRLTFQY